MFPAATKHFRQWDNNSDNRLASIQWNWIYANDSNSNFDCIISEFFIYHSIFHLWMSKPSIRRECLTVYWLLLTAILVNLQFEFNWYLPIWNRCRSSLLPDDWTCSFAVDWQWTLLTSQSKQVLTCLVRSKHQKWWSDVVYAICIKESLLSTVYCLITHPNHHNTQSFGMKFVNFPYFVWLIPKPHVKKSIFMMVLFCFFRFEKICVCWLFSVKFPKRKKN